MSESNTGEWLEVSVERLYRLLGASTSRRTLIEGYEIDVLARLSWGPVEVSLAIECKQYSGQRGVSQTDMEVFLTKLLIGQRMGRVDKGVFVTTTFFTKTALATAERCNIQCLTFSEFQDQLVYFKEYIDGALQSFDASNLARWYVPPKGSEVEDYELLSAESASQQIHQPLESYVDQVLFASPNKRLAVLGNFGAGKTCLCLSYRNTLLRRIKEDPSARLPIFINLRDFRSGIDIHELITSELQKLPGVRLNLGLCRELQRLGRFIFILDGLDEMATKVDRAVVSENLREIDRLSNEGDNLYLLTCRTHFFQERIAEEFLQDYEVIYLVEWGIAELELYLEKRFGQHAHAYLDRILRTPNLQELSRTPLLADMIAKSLSKIEGGEEPINSAQLYKAYTNEWVGQQSRRRGAVMSLTQRQRFVKALAAKLYTEDRAHLHFSELYEVAREFSGYGDATRLDYFDTDARTCTFITKDSNGNYGFRHRSFLEFFVAEALIDEIRSQIPLVFLRAALSPEVIYFLAGMGIDQGGIDTLMIWSRRFEAGTLSRNSLGVLRSINAEIPAEVAVHYQVGNEWSSLQRARASLDETDAFVSGNYARIYSVVSVALRRYPAMGIDPEDITQDVVLRLLLKRDIIESVTTNLDSYISRAVQAVLRDRLRVIQKRTPVELLSISRVIEPPDIAKNPVETMMEKELSEPLLKAISRLSPREQKILEIVTVERSAKEIGEELGIEPISVKVTLRRIISKLRLELEAGTL